MLTGEDLEKIRVLFRANQDGRSELEAEVARLRTIVAILLVKAGEKATEEEILAKYAEKGGGVSTSNNG